MIVTEGMYGVLNDNNMYAMLMKDHEALKVHHDDTMERKNVLRVKYERLKKHYVSKCQQQQQPSSIRGANANNND